MNTSFDPLKLVNTYGAFGAVGRERLNVVFEGTDADMPDDTAEWKAYSYKGLPVDPAKMPPQVAPYQLRLDWQMWFAAMSIPAAYPWVFHLIWKLLHNDANALSLFASNPFPNHPPRYIRAILYRYSFARPGNAQGEWWKREYPDAKEVTYPKLMEMPFDEQQRYPPWVRPDGTTPHAERLETVRCQGYRVNAVLIPLPTDAVTEKVRF